MGKQRAHRHFHDGTLPAHVRPALPPIVTPPKVVPTGIPAECWGEIPDHVKDELSGEAVRFAGVVHKLKPNWHAELLGDDGTWAKLKKTTTPDYVWKLLDEGVRIEGLAFRHIGHAKLWVILILGIGRPQVQAAE